MTTTDSDLAAELTRRLGRKHPVAAVATISASGTRTAVVGAATDAGFEIGSISKGITGLLYVDACSRGELTPETTLGELLPLEDSAAGSVTLGSVSTHTSGLPRLPPEAHALRRTLELWRHGTNPYGESVDELLEQSTRVTLSAPKPRYSNLGFELLGHAVAQAARTTYPELLADRLTTPLGLESMYAPSRPGELRPTAVSGTSRGGRVVQPWTGAGIAPAGGIRSSIGDMARLAESLLDGSAPGVGALDPVRDFSGGMRIGAAWLTLDLRGRLITWHNGGTGGFRSYLALDRRAGTAVVVLSATSRSVDGHGFRMLQALG